MRDTIAERTTGPYLATVLKLMAFNFNRSADLRRELYQRCNGLSRPFDSRFQFRTIDNAINLYLTIEGGRMRGGSGGVREPHVVATFRDAAAMRTFLSPFARSDPLNLMIDNKLSFEGNLSHLGRLGHLTAVARNRGWRKKLGAAPEAGDLAQAGDSMLAASRAERRRETLRCEPTDEVAVLDDPYLSRYGIDDFPRLKAMRAEFFGAHGEVCTERPRLVTEYYREHGFEADAEGREIDPELRQAGALHHVLTNKEPIIRGRALLPGTTTTKFPGVVIYPETGGTTIWAELMTVGERDLNPYRISTEDVDLLDREVFPFWVDRNVREWTRHHWNAPRCQQLDERWVLYFMWKTAAVSHTIPDYPGVLQRGLLAFREDAARGEANAADEQAGNFYRAVQTVIDGVLRYSERLADKAESMAAETGDAQRRDELLEMARICRKVPAGPRRSLHEALTVILLIQIALHMENMNAGLSIGRLDAWLQPYFLARRRHGEDDEGEGGRRPARHRARRLLLPPVQRPPAAGAERRHATLRRQLVRHGGHARRRRRRRQERRLRHDLRHPQGGGDADAARPEPERALSSQGQLPRIPAPPVRGERHHHAHAVDPQRRRGHRGARRAGFRRRGRARLGRHRLRRADELRAPHGAHQLDAAQHRSRRWRWRSTTASTRSSASRSARTPATRPLAPSTRSTSSSPPTSSSSAS